MSCASQYGSRLRLRGYRVTSQRMAILHVLRHSRGHLSPVAIHTRACRVLPGLTLPTVYRTLEFLVRTDLVWRTNLDKGHLAYELAESNHHHLVCRECGSQVNVQHALLRNTYAKLETASGYIVSHDHMTFSGLCPKCQKR